MDGLKAVEAYKAACSEIVTTYKSTPKPEIDNVDIDTQSQQLSAAKPQVILIDINMPVLNGFEATRRIRQFEQQNNIEPAIIIALTGLGSATAQQEAYSSGIDLFLTKPVRLKDLTGILEGVQDR